MYGPEVLMQQDRMMDAMKDDGERVRLQVDGFKSIFVPDHDIINKVPTTRVVTFEDIACGKEVINKVEEDSHNLDMGNVRRAVRERTDVVLSSRRTRHSSQSMKYKEPETDRSSGESSSESMYSLSSMDEDDLSDEGTAEDGSEDEMEFSKDEAISNGIDSSINECERQIAYVDAFRRVATKPPLLYSMVPPCIISSRQGLVPQDSQDASSMTMSLSDQMQEEIEDPFPEVEQSSSRKRSLLDTLADVAEQASKKPSSGGSKTVAVQKREEQVKNQSDMSQYHGFHLEYGMMCIHSDALREFTQPDPIYQDDALRWKKSGWSQDMLPPFHGEDIQKCIQYLKYAASMSGMLTDPPLKVQKTVVEQYAKHEDMLDNITSLHKRLRYGGMPTPDTRITRKIQKHLDLSISPLIFSPRRSLDGKRMSIKTDSRFSVKRTAIVQGDPASRTDVRWGACYQANIPSCSKGGKQSEIECEERLGGTLVMERGTIPPPMQNAVNLEEYKSMQRKEREEAILQQSNQLIDLVGPRSDLLGLTRMGVHAKDMLTEEQQIAYGEGMEKHGRNFPLIQKAYLPTVSCGSMATYYYDVWKTQSVPAAAKFYHERDHGDDPDAAQVIMDSIKWAKYCAQHPSRADLTSTDASDTLARALSCLEKNVTE
jgi:hypothetical protein